MPAFPATPVEPSEEGGGRQGPFMWSRRSEGPDAVRLRLSGELDLAAVEELRLALRGSQDPPRGLTVDLGGLDFVDCAALACLFRAAIELSRRGKGLVLVGAHGQVARLLAVTGFPPGVERLPDGPRLRLVPGPRAQGGAAASGRSE